MKLGLLLIALGFGYKVYAEAAKEKGTLRSIGQWVGAIMMATALVASTFVVYRISSFCTGGKGFFGSPFMRQASTAPSSK